MTTAIEEKLSNLEKELEQAGEDKTKAIEKTDQLQKQLDKIRHTVQAILCLSEDPSLPAIEMPVYGSVPQVISGPKSVCLSERQTTLVLDELLRLATAPDGKRNTCFR